MARQSVTISASGERQVVRWYVPQQGFSGGYRYLSRSFRELSSAKCFRDQLQACLRNEALPSHRVVTQLLELVRAGRVVVPLIGDEFTTAVDAGKQLLGTMVNLASGSDTRRLPPYSVIARRCRRQRVQPPSMDLLTCFDELTLGNEADGREADLLALLRERFLDCATPSHQAAILASICRLENWGLVFSCALDESTEHAFVDGEGAYHIESACDRQTPLRGDQLQGRFVRLHSSSIARAMRESHGLPPRRVDELIQLIPPRAILVAIGLSERDVRAHQLLEAYAAPKTNADRDTKAFFLRKAGSTTPFPVTAAEGTTVVGEYRDPAMWLQDWHIRLDNSLCTGAGKFTTYPLSGPLTDSRGNSSSSNRDLDASKPLTIIRHLDSQSSDVQVSTLVAKLCKWDGASRKVIWLAEDEAESAADLLSIVNRRLGRRSDGSEGLDSVVPLSPDREPDDEAMQRLLNRLDREGAVLVLDHLDQLASGGQRK